jgi:hypothetical protein
MDIDISRQLVTGLLIEVLWIVDSQADLGSILDGTFVRLDVSNCRAWLSPKS